MDKDEILTKCKNEGLDRSGGNIIFCNICCKRVMEWKKNWS